ncbi:hypothetical protein BD413DRAFT_305180 [Trametes elegans]|nr:hypothetical protein BD413DRAFT_305180 [Trametes elegans]
MTRTTRFLLSARFDMKARRDKQKAEAASARSKDRATAKGQPTAMINDRPALSKGRFPAEILDTILREAWYSVPLWQPATRWALFGAACLVNRQWRDATLRLATRSVTVCLRSNMDLAGYCAVGRQYLATARIAPKATATDTQDQPGNRPSTFCALPERRVLANVFRHATISLYAPYFNPDVTGREVVSEDVLVRLMSTGGPLESQWCADDNDWLTTLRRVVPDGKRVSLSTSMGVGLTLALSHERTAIFVNYVATLPSVVSLDCNAIIAPSETGDKPRNHALFPWERLPSSVPPLPRIRHLRFKDYPACTCPARELGRGHAESYCFAYQLTTAFPRVEHLHLDTPVSLKDITPPATLRTLTLEVPLGTPVASQGVSTSLHRSVVGYNLDAALKLGLLGTRLPSSKQREIVLRTTGDELTGWAEAQVACERHSIVLVRRQM